MALDCIRGHDRSWALSILISLIAHTQPHHSSALDQGAFGPDIRSSALGGPSFGFGGTGGLVAGACPSSPLHQRFSRLVSLDDRAEGAAAGPGSPSGPACPLQAPPFLHRLQSMPEWPGMLQTLPSEPGITPPHLCWPLLQSFPFLHLLN